MNQGKIFAVGIGPGGLDLLAPQARMVLEKVDVIVGYRPYLDLLGNLIADKEVVSTGMRGEVARCRSAISKARQGKMVAVVSSGDAGIYGMAGLLIELEENEKEPLIIEIVPGITAANAAAAALGAPLMNDFAILSLSDWLTPLDEVKRRVKAIAAADLVCVLYNPQSRSRRELLTEVINEFDSARGSSTIVGTVRNAGRTGEKCWLGNIAQLPIAEVDMVTVVLIGNSRTAIINNRMVTRRGYRVD
ncbi:MAG: precorrin-3B C(17)-methyltransferase [Deltaproteobacteria bacterium]|nr:precorrin-3B C(17)-methyltransferase [Candidatus Tharpella sp.]